MRRWIKKLSSTMLREKNQLGMPMTRLRLKASLGKKLRNLLRKKKRRERLRLRQFRVLIKRYRKKQKKQIKKLMLQSLMEKIIMIILVRG